ncbi:MAG: hypothetical protein M0Z82_12795 [Actinomycetota bacterium]|nr:hypothetical protein [Actinomycetota bacterium]
MRRPRRLALDVVPMCLFAGVGRSAHGVGVARGTRHMIGWRLVARL